MREDLLRRCLQSLRDNLDLPYRIIIINSGKRPLFFEDERIKVINDPKIKGTNAKRQLFTKLVDTEFMFALDNDIVVWPRSLEVQIEALDENPQLAAVSGLAFEKGKFCSWVADIDFVGDKVTLRCHSLEEILASKGELFEADFVPIGHTTFRMKAFDDIAIDLNYKVGYAHWDIFMQLYYSDWKCAVHKKSWFGHLKYLSPREYRHWRLNARRIEAGRKYFREKWGYQPVWPSKIVETRKQGVVLKVLRWAFRRLKRFLKETRILT